MMDEFDHIDQSVFNLSIAFIVLTFMATALRFAMRARSNVPFAADDWWLLTSVVCFYGYLAILLYGTQLQKEVSPTQHRSATVDHGILGAPTPNLLIDTLKKLKKLEYAAAPLFVTTLATAKISILCLYCRIFSHKRFRRDSTIVGFGVCAYWVIAILATLFQCRPVNGAWQLLPQSQCIDFAAMFLGVEIWNCILDVVILCLPLREIRQLSIPRRKKFGLGVIFTLGSFVFVAGIVHMAVSYRAGVPTLAFTGNIVMSTVENGLAIICACLPTYGPIINGQLFNVISDKIDSMLGFSATDPARSNSYFVNYGLDHSDPSYLREQHPLKPVPIWNASRSASNYKIWNDQP